MKILSRKNILNDNLTLLYSSPFLSEEYDFILQSSQFIFPLEERYPLYIPCKDIELKKESTEFIQKTLDFFPLKNKNILEIGCNMGVLTNYIYSSFKECNVFGIDTNEFYLKCAKKLYPNISNNFYKLSFLDLFKEENKELMDISNYFLCSRLWGCKNDLIYFINYFYKPLQQMYPQSNKKIIHINPTTHNVNNFEKRSKYTGLEKYSEEELNQMNTTLESYFPCAKKINKITYEICL